jgi:hypothetical protein
MTRTKSGIASWGLWAVLAISAVAVGVISLRYLSFDPELAPPDLRPNLDARPFFFYGHAVIASLALLIGVWQFLPATRRGRYHRWAGRLYLVCVVPASIAGFIIALYTEMGPEAGVGFAILAVLWLSTTLMAYARIRAKDYASHRVWMIRSYALACAAITLRIILPVGQAAGASFHDSYVIAAWGSWIINLAIAEWIIRKTKLKEIVPPVASPVQ